jgi:cytochrome c556
LRAVAIGTAVTLLTLASVALLFVWLWSLTGRLDGDAARQGLTSQFMQRKTAALLEIRDGSEAGDLGRAKQGAAQLRRISEAASSYLPDQGYNALRGDFADALAVLDAAVRDRDLVRLKAAYAKLAESCLECHRRATKTRIDAKSFQVITTEQPPRPE